MLSRFVPDGQARTAADDETLARWRGDPVAFAVEACGIQPWDVQADVMQDVAEHHRVAVRSGHKVGKSLLVVLLALWWAVCWGGCVVLTAPTARQVKDILWKTLRQLSYEARRIGAIELPVPPKDPSTGLRWEDGRFIVGISTDEPERMQGYSGPRMFYAVDEASGVSADIFEAIEGNTAGGAKDDPNAIAKVLLTGNPTQTSGVFFDAFNGSTLGWRTHRVSSEETPNARLGRVVVPGLATLDYVEEKRKEWGEDSDLYRVRVLGDFPREGGCQVIPLDVVTLCQRRAPDELPYVAQLQLGVDVARFGDDFSAVVARRGKAHVATRRVNGFDEPAVAGLVLDLVRELRKPGEPIPIVKVDSCGVGLGVASILRQARDGNGDPMVIVVEVDAGAKAIDEDAYRNKRSELWFACRDWLDSGASLLDDDVLARDLMAPTYGFDLRGRRVVEKKESFKKRLKRSPDTGDALCLAVYQLPESPGIQAPAVAPSIGYRFGHARGFG